MIIGYARVSTVEQNEARQVEALNKEGCEKIFADKTSGKNTNRPQLQAMMDFAREGDTVVVSEYSRLARSTADLLAIVDMLGKKGVAVKSLHERMDTSKPDGRLMLTVIGAIAEFERDLILERQREGIAIAKQAGRYHGRKKIAKPSNWQSDYAAYQRRELSAVALAERCHASKSTIYGWIHEERTAKQTA